MTPLYFNTAYPGSMFAKPHGQYLDKDDIPSILAHLSNHMRDLQLAADDAQLASQDLLREKLDLDQELNSAYAELSELKRQMDL